MIKPTGFFYICCKSCNRPLALHYKESGKSVLNNGRILFEETVVAEDCKYCIPIDLSLESKPDKQEAVGFEDQPSASTQQ